MRKAAFPVVLSLAILVVGVVISSVGNIRSHRDHYGAFVGAVLLVMGSK